MRYVSLIVFLLLHFAGGILASVLTLPSIKTWYVHLNKPTWTPPNWVFGPAWSVLYILISVAAWLVWEKRHELEIKNAMLVFALHYVTNNLWSYLFFGMQQPAIAFVDIAILWLTICAMIVSFRKIDKNTTLLLLPYLFWVTYAASLNMAIWIMN